MSESTNCPDCAAAESNPSHSGYRASCMQCECRAIAASDGGYRAAKALSNTEIDDASRKVAKRFETNAESVRRSVWRWIGVVYGVVRS